MNLYINSASTPPSVQLKANSSPISSMKLKRGAVVPLSVTLMGVQEASNLRFGIKSSYEGDMLALAWADTGTPTENGLCFELALRVNSTALDAALHVGDLASSLSKLTCMAEFAWVENDELRVSDTLAITLLNDIVRMANAPTDGEDMAIYPTPDTIATKDWVRSQNSEQLNTALIQPSTNYYTPASTRNDTFLWVDIPAKYLSVGNLTSLSLKAGSDTTGMYTQAVYLCIHQMTAVMDVWEAVAVSNNSQVFGAGKTLTWQFSNARLNGNRIRLCLLTTRSSGPVWRETINFRAACRRTTKWQEGYTRTSSGDLLTLPQLVITMAVPSNRYAPNNHAKDVEVHLTADERAGLTALLGIKSQLLAAFPPTATTEEESPEDTPPGMEAYLPPAEQDEDIQTLSDDELAGESADVPEPPVEDIPTPDPMSPQN